MLSYFRFTQNARDRLQHGETQNEACLPKQDVDSGAAILQRGRKVHQSPIVFHGDRGARM